MRNLVEENAKKWLLAAKKRTSVRKFAEEMSHDEREYLKTFISELSDDKCRVELVENVSEEANAFLGRRFACVSDIFVFIKNKNISAVGVGYKCEQLILECTSMGLGTCWVGSYSRKLLESMIDLKNGESIVAITPVGKPHREIVDENPPRDRKPLSKLLDKKSKEVFMENWQKNAISCARIAPSAMNQQKWLFSLGRNFIDIRMAGLSVTPQEMLDLDMGIAMLHMEIGAIVSGAKVSWIRNDDRFTLEASSER